MDFLTGAMSAEIKLADGDVCNMPPRFTPEAMRANGAMVDLIARVAGQKGATRARIALAWLLAKKPWIVPIPGTTKLHRLEENLAAVDVELTADDLRDMDTAASEIEVRGGGGARYTEQMEQMSGR